MSNASLKWVAAMVVSIVAAGGCAGQRPGTPPQPTPPPRVASDPVVRVQTLSRLADSFARISNELPGSDAREHRRLMAELFAQLEEILPILQGADGGAGFRQQIQIIRDAQAELASGPQDLSPDPTIDSGLRAARDALASIAQSAYYNQADLMPLFDNLSSKINELDTVRGPLHQIATADAVEVMKQIISKMSDALSHQLAEQNATTTATPPAPTAPSATEATEK